MAFLKKLFFKFHIPTGKSVDNDKEIPACWKECLRSDNDRWSAQTLSKIVILTNKFNWFSLLGIKVFFAWNPLLAVLSVFEYQFGIIKQTVSWFDDLLLVGYFYIIKRERKKLKAEMRNPNWLVAKATQGLQKIFFIWQAIVNGQLFLQMTFFF